MKAIQDRLHDPWRSRAESAIEAGIVDLFRRLPFLLGFTVQERNAELCVADVAVLSWSGLEAGTEVYNEIARALGELVEERPCARELLRGRTFARTLQ